jgi:hypothetical protein
MPAFYQQTSSEMARMIPSFCDPATPSGAERRMFELLKSDPATTDWVVLHSLGLARRGTKPYGEIDFVVLVPGAGVFCLEVKGGGVSCANGVWTSKDKYGVTHAINRSPFLQAREGMFEVQNTILHRAPMGFPTGLVFGYAVILPDVSFDVVCQEWETWQVMDRDTLLHPISAAVLRLAARQRSMKSHVPAGEPTLATMRIVQQLLRPDFEVVVTCGAQIDETEMHLLKMTEEQFDRVDMLMDNAGCLIEGPAGTGKTMLAVEYARRSAAEGKRTLLICFNRLLGEWLGKRAAALALGPTLVAGSFHRLMREIILRSTAASDFRNAEQGSVDVLFAESYPFYGLLALEELNQPFDVLVVDEAQDLLQSGIVAVLDLALRGGWAHGHWAAFGDFQQQAIYSSATAEEMRALLVAAAPGHARGRLRTNCRNTRNIGEETALLSGFDAPPYRLGQIAGLPVDYQYYATADEQRSKVTAVLRRLLAGGVRASEILLLSPVKLPNSGVAGLEGGTDFRLVEVDESIPERSRIPLIRYCTAQAFKGMESQVVLLCDIGQINDRAPQSLLYVAMSRARAHLTVFLHEQTKPHMSDKIRLRLTDTWGKAT